MADTMLARIKPFDKNKSHVIKRYACSGKLFTAEGGWYKVDVELATYLKTVVQNEKNTDGPKVFDVCTEEEAREIARVEAMLRDAGSAGSPRYPVDTVKAPPRTGRRAAPAGQSVADVVAGAEADVPDEASTTLTTKDLQPEKPAAPAVIEDDDDDEFEPEPEHESELDPPPAAPAPKAPARKRPAKKKATKKKPAKKSRKR